jgi:hypothetical protein
MSLTHTLSLSLSGHTHTHTQLGETETYLKAAQAQTAQKNREIDALRKERDRLLSQNRLAQMKQAGGVNGYGNNNNKRPRMSF